MAKKSDIWKVDNAELVAVTTQDVESRMIMLRNQPVLIDADVAALYGVETREVNQAVKNNPKKFPYGYIFELDKYVFNGNNLTLFCAKKCQVISVKDSLSKRSGCCLGS